MNNVSTIIDEVVSIKSDVLNSFKIQDTLYPNIWIGSKLNPFVRKRLLIIARDFLNDLDLTNPIHIRDVVITGSAANYNWSKYSDIDLHIRMDFDTVDQNEEIVQKMFDSSRALWNKQNDITIYDLPVEIYVEQVGESHTSSGLYSLIKNKWIKIPEKNELIIDVDDIKSKSNKFIDTILYLNELMSNENYSKCIIAIQKIKDKIKRMRRSGLAKGGEYSIENLTFKVLRRSGYIEELYNLNQIAYNQLRSIE